jgi:O-antigen ligase
MSDERKYWLDDPANVKLLIRVFYGVCAVLLSLDFFFHRHLSFENSTAEFPMEGYYGFYGFYGFVACVLLVVVAKYVLRKIVMRSEDYYDE